MSTPSDAGFGARLRMERERRRISLASVAETTKISRALFVGLERDDVSRWPSGIFRRSFVRAYAQAVGLDPDEIAREFLELYPDPLEVKAQLSAMGPLAAAARPTRPVLATELRLTIADSGAQFRRGRLIAEARRRWVAAALDVGAVVAIGLLLYIALGRFWMPFAVVMLGYYAGSIVLLGNTPGVSLFAPESRQQSNQSLGQVTE